MYYDDCLLSDITEMDADSRYGIRNTQYAITGNCNLVFSIIFIFTVGITSISFAINQFNFIAKLQHIIIIVGSFSVRSSYSEFSQEYGISGTLDACNLSFHQVPLVEISGIIESL